MTGTRPAGEFCLKHGARWMYWQMNDTECFYRTLGLSEPWQADAVKREPGENGAPVRVAVKERTKWVDDGKLQLVAGCEGRIWQHLDTMQVETVITARVPTSFVDGGVRAGGLEKIRRD